MSDIQIITEEAFKRFPRLINDPYNPLEDDNAEEREIWLEGVEFGLNINLNLNLNKNKN